MLTKKNKILNMTFTVNNEIQQVQSKNILLSNELDINRKRQISLSKEESKLQHLIKEKSAILYNLVRIPIW